MSMKDAVEKLLAELGELTPQLTVLAEAARALAIDIDLAGVPTEKGPAKSAAAPVRELRAVVDELMTKGRRNDDGDDWSNPGDPVPGVTPIRDAKRSDASDARPRSRAGGKQAG